MTGDLLLRGGSVVDGTGLPAYTADVEVRRGRIARVGRVRDWAGPVLDVDGLVVTPGFVDIHTHYDAQLWFEPTASPSSWHGVTTVLTGNCGFSLAPCRPEDVAWTLDMLSRVEGMSAAALAAGVAFRGGSLGEFLDGLEARVAVNAGVYVGHCALRRWVLGKEASERAARTDEVTAMAALLRASLRQGAMGFSTSQLDLHRDHEGRPVPSNLASVDEIVALARVLGEFDRGAIEIFPRTFVAGYSDSDRALLLEIARVSGKPVHANATGWFAGFPDSWRHTLDLAEEAAREGLRIHPMFIVNPKGLHFALADTFVFDELASFREVLTLPPRAREQRLRDPAARDAMRRDLADPAQGSLRFAWDEVRVAAARDPQHAPWSGQSVAELALSRGQDPLDCLLDLSLEEDLETVFVLDREPGDEHRRILERLVAHPAVMAGSSDGGAHLQTFCGADYTTRLLTEGVRDGLLSFEQAVSKLTMVPAAVSGLWDRGLVRPGMAGDLVVLDPRRLAVGPIRCLRDFPAGTSRLVFEARGYAATIVAGQVIVRDGTGTGALPGAVLRANPPGG